LVSVASASFAATPEEVADARRYFEAGKRAFAETKYDAAIAAFRQAQRVSPHPAILFTLAQAHRLRYFVTRQPDDLAEARRLYTKYLGEAKRGRRRDHAVEHLSTIEPLILRLEAAGKLTGGAAVKGPPTQLMVSVSVDGATVRLDDGAPSEAPLIEVVEPGSHAIVVEAAGYFTKETSRVVTEGLIAVVDVELEPIPATVRVTAPEGARVLVGGQLAGEAPLTKALSLPEGTHRIEVLASGQEPYVRELATAKAATIDLDIDLDATTQRHAAWWILGAAGVSAIAGGVTLGLAIDAETDAKAISNRLEAGKPLTAEQIDRYGSRKASRGRLRPVAGGFLIATLVTGVTGALLYAFDEPEALPVDVSIGADGAAVSLTVPIQ